MKKFEAIVSLEKKVFIYAKDIVEATRKADEGQYWGTDDPPIKRTILMVYPAQVDLDDAIEEGTRVWNAVNSRDLRK